MLKDSLNKPVGILLTGIMYLLQQTRDVKKDIDVPVGVKDYGKRPDGCFYLETTGFLAGKEHKALVRLEPNLDWDKRTLSCVLAVFPKDFHIDTITNEWVDLIHRQGRTLYQCINHMTFVHAIRFEVSDNTHVYFDSERSVLDLVVANWSLECFRGENTASEQEVDLPF